MKHRLTIGDFADIQIPSESLTEVLRGLSLGADLPMGKQGCSAQLLELAHIVDEAQVDQGLSNRKPAHGIFILRVFWGDVDVPNLTDGVLLDLIQVNSNKLTQPTPKVSSEQGRPEVSGVPALFEVTNWIENAQQVLSGERLV